MTPPQKATAKPTFRPGQLLDWSDRTHWSWTAKQCRWCPGLTHLRDSGRHPAHKVCAEQAIAHQHEDAADAYQTGHLG